MTTMARSVAAETLDGLAADDPAAVHSRRDLRRLHRLMGTRSILVRQLGAMALPKRAEPLRVLELGAGDGSLLLGVARALGAARPAVELTLLDRQALADRATLDAYAALGWRAEVCVADALDWAQEAAAGPSSPRWDLIVANLFLHHFDGALLAALLRGVGARGERFLACEPRRGRLALAASRLVGLIGANAVTREDAVLSVRAGFRGDELSALWKAARRDDAGWKLHERAAGPFSHCFRAERVSGAA